MSNAIIPSFLWIAYIQSAIWLECSTNPASSVITVSSGDQYTCALLNTQIAMCWGLNGYGQLGIWNLSESILPAAIDLGTGKCWNVDIMDLDREDAYFQLLTWSAALPTAITCGTTHSCALLNSGSVMCWGFNDHGQVGPKNITKILGPTIVEMSPGLPYILHLFF